MTPAKLNKKWWERLRSYQDPHTDEPPEDPALKKEYDIIMEFLIDIEWLRVEETEDEKKNRELISKIADRFKKDIKEGRIKPIKI